MSMKVKIYPSDTPTIFDQDVFLGTSVSGQSNDLTIGKFLGWKDWSIKGFDTEGQPIEDSKGNLTDQYLEINGSGVDFEQIRDTVRVLGCETPRHDGERNNHESHFTGKNRSGFRLVRGDLFLNFVTNRSDFSDELKRVISLLKKNELTFEHHGRYRPSEEGEVYRGDWVLNYRSPDPEEIQEVDYFDGPSVRDDTSLSISLSEEYWSDPYKNKSHRWILISIIEDLGRTTEEMINEDNVRKEDLWDIQRSVVEDCLSQLTEPPQSESVEVVR
ncbi:MAG: hypothetical protein VW270_14830 [Candidatus Poseidoniales archaeon]